MPAAFSWGCAAPAQPRHGRDGEADLTIPRHCDVQPFLGTQTAQRLWFLGRGAPRHGLHGRPLPLPTPRGPAVPHYGGAVGALATWAPAVSQLAKLIGRLGKDDVLMVTRLDLLARSTKDLLNTIGAVADKGAGFRSLRDTWADTTTAHGRLMLTVLGGLAEFERELIRSRTSEGRERAKAKGVVMVRKPKLTHHQRQEAIARREAGESLVDIGRSYNVSHSTISRLA